MTLRADRGSNRVVLRPVHPNAGVAAALRRELELMIRAMHKDVLAHIKAAWERRPPVTVVLAHDAPSAVEQLRQLVASLTDRWLRQFDAGTEVAARYWARAAAGSVDRGLRGSLKNKGITVEFHHTPATADVIEASVAQNVSLIRSIPRRYFDDIEGLVMRSAQQGRDLGALAAKLQKTYGIAKRRAAIIARDQNNKISSAMNRVRQMELGIARAVWKHSHAGKVPRPSHVKMDGKEFDVAEGMWDPAEGRHVHPGELINCRCQSRSIVPGLRVAA